MFQYRCLDPFARFGREPVGAAGRFRNDLVDDTEFKERLRGNLERLGGLGRKRAVAPEDARAAFRRNDRVNGILQHQHRIADADAERAAAPAFAGDDRDDRNGRAAPFR